MNWASSRSHAVFTVFIERTAEPGNLAKQVAAGGAAAVRADGVTRTKLHIIDLAGSEKMKKIGDGGRAGGRGSQQLEETKATNLSLLAVGKMIHALAEGNAHVPYRDSKLTRLLQVARAVTAVTAVTLPKLEAHAAAAGLAWRQRMHRRPVQRVARRGMPRRDALHAAIRRACQED